MTRTDCKHPDITVQLSTNDGNAFAIIGAVTKALRKNDLADEIPEFTREAMSGDYDALLRTCMKWVNVE